MAKLENLEKGWGGKRKGSGRKKEFQAKKDFEARALFKKAWDRTMTYEDLVALITEAKKDKWLFKLLLEQRIGRAAQGIEMSGKDGEPVEFKVILDEGKTNKVAE